MVALEIMSYRHLGKNDPNNGRSVYVTTARREGIYMEATKLMHKIALLLPGSSAVERVACFPRSSFCYTSGTNSSYDTLSQEQPTATVDLPIEIDILVSVLALHICDKKIDYKTITEHLRKKTTAAKVTE